MMVSSKAKTVDEYITNLSGERKLAIEKLRKIIKNIHPEASETMEYKMPTYKSGDLFYAMASQKNYISFYVNNTETVESYKDMLGKANLGKSCIRYRHEKDIKYDVIEKMMRDIKRTKQEK